MKKALLLVFLLHYNAEALPQAEEVFWWWDDGLISYEQVEEFLELLNTNDESGFCALMEGYLNQSCPSKKKPITKGGLKSNVKKKYAKVHWKAEIDSSSFFQNQRFHITTFFKPFTFEARQDSIFTLTYQRKKNTATLGHITYSLLGTGIPLAPVRGYFGELFINTASMGFLFTQDLDWGVQMNLTKSSHHFKWHFYSFQRNPFILVLYKNKIADISLWCDLKSLAPLARLRLKFPEKKTSSWEWKGDFFYHQKDSIKAPIHLPKSVVKNSLWSVQHQNFKTSFLSLSFYEKIGIPIDTGITQISLQVAVKLFSSKNFLETTFSCRDAHQHCKEPQARLHLFINPKKELEFFVKSQIQGKSFSTWWELPQTIFGLNYIPEKEVSFKNELVFPAKSVKKPVSWRQSTQIKNNNSWTFTLHFEVQIQDRLSFRPYRTGISFSLEY